MSTQQDFGELLRELRTSRGWSLRDLGDRIHFNRGHVGKVEQGSRFPQVGFAVLADHAMNTGHQLVDAWEAQSAERDAAAKRGQLLDSTVRDSLQLIGTEDTGDLDSLTSAAEELAVDYLSSPAASMLPRAVEVRRRIIGRLRDRNYRLSQLPNLQIALGRVQGVLSYAALDLGSSTIAMTHSEAAWVLANRADDNELRAWVRGTQSLIARFDSDYPLARELIHDGLKYDAAGEVQIRLIAGLAQCRANLGDSPGANDALDQAAHARARLHLARTTAGGLFEFTLAKQHYYAGSSLMWLPNPGDSKRAAREAALAILMWADEPRHSRSLDDEALAHVYQATALTRLGDIAGANDAVQPILNLPPERMISWITRRLNELADHLDAADGSDARDLAEVIRAGPNSRTPN
jgi:transcriptional regulator with XRE-family HTH domain